MVGERRRATPNVYKPPSERGTQRTRIWISSELATESEKAAVCVKQRQSRMRRSYCRLSSGALAHDILRWKGVLMIVLEGVHEGKCRRGYDRSALNRARGVEGDNLCKQCKQKLELNSEPCIRWTLPSHRAAYSRVRRLREKRTGGHHSR